MVGGRLEWRAPDHRSAAAQLQDTFRRQSFPPATIAITKTFRRLGKEVLAVASFALQAHKRNIQIAVREPYST